MLLLLFALTMPVIEREGVVKGFTLNKSIVLPLTTRHSEALRRAEGKNLRCEVRGIFLSRVYEITSESTVDFNFSEGVRPAPKVHK